MTLENENNQAESGDYKGEERRQTFRYLFEKRDALKIRFKQKEIHLLEISAGGLRFVNQGFQKLETGSITVTLKIPGHKNNTTFCADLRILTIDDDNHCHCLFENCNLADYELVHQYVLEMQKKDGIILP